MEEETRTTMIVLSKSDNATHFREDELIHWRKLKEVLSWIDADLRLISDNERVRVNHAISIIGDRGSGKTSFLRTLKETLSRERKNLYPLEIIDPTLIEEKAHPFLIVLSLIKEAFYSSYENSHIDKHNYSRQEWECYLEELAAGLPSIESLSNTLREDPSWQDPNFIMRKGLNAVKSACSIQSTFRKLVKCTLKVLDKEAFVIFLDDIDIDFKKGWPVLEMLRKYLDIPEIITIISGELHLFSKAVRKQQWMNFGKALLKNEVDRWGTADRRSEQEYERLVTNMEQQYMRKVLRPERMIVLPYLSEWNDWSINKLNNIYIQISGETKQILECYNEIFTHFGIFNILQRQVFISYVLSLPIRTQIQFLTGFYEAQKNGTGRFILEAFIREFLSSEVDVFMMRGKSTYFVPAILEFMRREDLLDTFYQLRPITGRKEIDVILFAFSLSFSRRVPKRPELIFDYWIRVCYLRNLLHLNKNEEKNGSPTLSNALLHAILGSQILGSIAKKGSALGTFRIQNPKAQKFIETRQSLCMLPFSRINYQGKKTYVCSIMFILSIIYDILLGRRRYEEEKNDIKNDIKNENEQIILTKIKEYTTIREYIDDIPLIETGQTEEEQDNSSLHEPSYIDELKSMATMMEEWAASCPHSATPPYLLGRMFTKFRYAERKIVSEFAESSLSHTLPISEVLHRTIIAFMNAILYEEAREKLGNEHTELQENLSISSDREFFKNISIILKPSEGHPPARTELTFSKWLLRCPLLLCFLNLDTLKSEGLSFLEFTKANANRDVTKLRKMGLYKQLNYSIAPLPKLKKNLETISKVIELGIKPDTFRVLTDYDTLPQNEKEGYSPIINQLKLHFDAISLNDRDTLKQFHIYYSEFIENLSIKV